MKIKPFLIATCALFATSTMTAQKADEGDVRYFSPKFKDNLFISIGVGAQGYINVDNLDYGFGHAFKPYYSLSLGKMITPVWGIRGIFTGYQTTLHTDFNHRDAMGEPYFVEYSHKYIGFGADVIVNLTNTWREYNPESKFDLVAYVGPGLTFARSDKNKITPWINGSVGLAGKYNISKSFAIDLEVRGTMLPSIYGDLSRSAVDGIFATTLGVTYTIGGKKQFKYRSGVDEQFKAYDDQLAAYNKKISDLENELAAALDENSKLKSAKPIVKPEPQQVAVDNKQYVGFLISRSDVLKQQLVTLQAVADYLKANPSAKATVVGYADKGTGTAAGNQKLSEKRAKTVYDLLCLKFNVDKSRLAYEGKGGEVQPFNEPYMNRLVVITME
ncbi:MAG: OmpA family protein [Alistipes sp.]|nr:OmpA family protein [Alistipes sp.]